MGEDKVKLIIDNLCFEFVLMKIEIMPFDTAAFRSHAELNYLQTKLVATRFFY